MARLPRPSKDYDPLNMARELNAAIDGRPVAAPPKLDQLDNRRSNLTRDYRRTLFESLFT